MGVQFCKASNLTKEHESAAEKNQPQFSYLSEYYEQNWPSDDEILHSLLRLSTIYNKKLAIKPLKHKIFTRWFWGPRQAGEPYGNGILYNVLGSTRVYYEGEFEAGGPKGFGRVVYNGGQWEYNGYISKGKANGKGELFNRKNRFKFDGQWKQSMPYIGKLTLFGLAGSEASTNSNSNTSQNKSIGDIVVKLDYSKSSKVAQIDYPDGKTYIGQINHQKYIPEGRGMILFPNQSKYEGDWQEGQMHGHGKFEWTDGSYYEGDYFEGKKQGRGLFCYPSGNFYNGHWSNGRQHGKGILYDQNHNEIKSGMWRDGIFQN